MAEDHGCGPALYRRRPPQPRPVDQSLHAGRYHRGQRGDQSAAVDWLGAGLLPRYQEIRLYPLRRGAWQVHGQGRQHVGPRGHRHLGPPRLRGDLLPAVPVLLQESRRECTVGWGDGPNFGYRKRFVINNLQGLVPDDGWWLCYTKYGGIAWIKISMGSAGYAKRSALPGIRKTKPILVGRSIGKAINAVNAGNVANSGCGGNVRILNARNSMPRRPDDGGLAISNFHENVLGMRIENGISGFRVSRASANTALRVVSRA